MTIAMLLENTLVAALRFWDFDCGVACEAKLKIEWPLI